MNKVCFNLTAVLHAVSNNKEYSNTTFLRLFSNNFMKPLCSSAQCGHLLINFPFSSC